MVESKINILYVEDNPDDQLILTRSLKQKMPINYDLKTVDTATKGLNIVQKENFDLLISDYRLPDMTGIELVQELKKKSIEIPIILLTSKGSENVAVEAMKLGVQDYVIKDDLDSQRLIDSIKEIVLQSTLPETVDIKTAKAIIELFAQKPTIHIEYKASLTSNPESEVPAEQLSSALRELADKDVVEAEDSHSVVACPDCGSLNTLIYLECPECESTKIRKEEALEHFDCGNIDFRSKFDKGDGVLTCPKCGKKLKVIGVDYRKIENWYRCSNKHFFGQPNFKFACPKCNKRFSLEEAKLEMLHQYKLTTMGSQMLKLGIKATEMTEKRR
ncbi:MAG: response regulator [Candidatus Bathyarchaeota archaeon]|nr:response regulator [Candidatus Bathyarchaeum sp.]